ncbi:unnamed protein product [Linum trigynum]|uniref:Uncharacterized protein n=1 Tax=Linum trigynum TaxID=586398 RepID=A0AAV2FYA1_9ROSI
MADCCLAVKEDWRRVAALRVLTDVVARAARRWRTGGDGGLEKGCGAAGEGGRRGKWRGDWSKAAGRLEGAVTGKAIGGRRRPARQLEGGWVVAGCAVGVAGHCAFFRRGSEAGWRPKRREGLREDARVGDGLGRFS